MFIFASLLRPHAWRTWLASADRLPVSSIDCAVGGVSASRASKSFNPRARISGSLPLAGVGLGVLIMRWRQVDEIAWRGAGCGGADDKVVSGR